MATRDYVGVGITVHWDSERCFHSERCTTGLPTVFDRSRRPWVDLADADANEVAAVIDTCPSGALSYTRTDGARNGRRGREDGEDPTTSTAVDEGWMPVSTPTTRATVTVRPLSNGPYAVVGPIVLVQPGGETIELSRCDLCRCGGSGSKPYCDGTHARIGFTAAGVEPGVG